MYRIVHSKKFKKALKKIERSGICPMKEIRDILHKRSLGKKLDEKYQDHQLHGKMSVYRECHIKNDLLSVYELNKDELVLLTIDIGSHPEIFR